MTGEKGGRENEANLDGPWSFMGVVCDAADPWVNHELCNGSVAFTQQYTAIRKRSGSKFTALFRSSREFFSFVLSFTCLVGLALFGTLSSGVNGADGRESVSNDLKSAVDKPISPSKLDHSEFEADFLI